MPQINPDYSLKKNMHVRFCINAYSSDLDAVDTYTFLG